MGIETAAVLHLRDDTTVDTGVGINILLLSASTTGFGPAEQSASATHTQDSVERTFDPLVANVTNTNHAGDTLFKRGWALRLTDDMTPSDDTNCNAALTAGDATINLVCKINQTGGTYAGGNYGPTWRASLWRYNISADTGVLIAAGSVATPTWGYTPASGDLNTYKNVVININVPSIVEFQPGEVLLLQVGLNTGTIPNPTLGTATWTYTLAIEPAGQNCNITWDTSPTQGIRTLCPIDGTVAGVGEALGVPVIVKPTAGTDTAIATVLGAMQADANMAGTSAGTVTVTGALQADANMAGTSAGIATADGALGAVLGTVGTVEIGAVGGETIIRPLILLSDD